MSEPKFTSFPDLYRAAFAERNPEKKMALLSEVKRALDDWERSSENWVAAPNCPPRSDFGQASISRPMLVA